MPQCSRTTLSRRDRAARTGRLALPARPETAGPGSGSPWSRPGRRSVCVHASALRRLALRDAARAAHSLPGCPGRTSILISRRRAHTRSGRSPSRTTNLVCAPRPPLGERLSHERAPRKQPATSGCPPAPRTRPASPARGRSTSQIVAAGAAARRRPRGSTCGSGDAPACRATPCRTSAAASASRPSRRLVGARRRARRGAPGPGAGSTTVAPRTRRSRRALSHGDRRDRRTGQLGRRTGRRLAPTSWHLDGHAHLLVQRARELVRARHLELALERVVRRGRLGLELLHPLGAGDELDVVDVARRLEAGPAPRDRRAALDLQRLRREVVVAERSRSSWRRPAPAPR